MRIKVFFTFILIPLFFIAQNDTIKLNEIIVNANRVASRYNEELRIVQILDKETLKNLPINSVADILDYVGFIDARQRGMNNIQSDLSIRGSNYEQVLIMLNGIPVNDPQTGHHSMNISINDMTIDRIEILAGGDARRYGANAFAGAINIVTKSSVQNNLQLTIRGGDFKYIEGQVTGMYRHKNTHLLLSAARAQSQGYRPNTDFIHHQALWQIFNSGQKNHFHALIGYENKAFGANSFYTPKYPDQFEKTHTLFASITDKFFIDNKTFTIQTYYRQHHDRFELFREDRIVPPSWYKSHNYHLTSVMGGQLNMFLYSKYGKITIGTDYRLEKILSNVLGDLINDTFPDPYDKNGWFIKKGEKSYWSLFANDDIKIRKWAISFGLMSTYLLQKDWYFYPGFEIGYFYNNNLRWFVAVNRSLRLPSYTELYYNDPVHQGNINLSPEEAINYEGGIKFNSKSLVMQAAYFYRQGKNIIDWVRPSSTDKWHTMNITTVNTSGVEFMLTYYHEKNYSNSKLKTIQFNYTYLNILKQSENYYSKYALDVLRHKISLIVNHNIIGNIFATWTLLYHERMGTYTEYPTGLEKTYKPYATIDAKINYNYKNINIFISGTNLFNTYYYDIANIPMPGRWVKGGFSWSLK